MQTSITTAAAARANGMLASHELAHTASTALAEQIANRVAATWKRIDDALSPILGARGTGALYERSLRLTTAANPWLKDAWQGGSTPMDLASLEAVLSMQTATTAAAGSQALLHTFRDLLSTLVGVALTERLLRTAGAPAVVQ